MQIVEEREDGSRRVALICEDKSLTKQSEADACDINKIMAKYERSGILQHVSLNEAFYADVSNVPDYQAALAIVVKADEMFMSLPGDVRARFENNPQKYLDFVSNPANKDEMIKMGLLNPLPAEPVPLKVEVVNPAVQPSAK